MKPTYASFFANLSDAERHSTIPKPRQPPPPPQTRLTPRGRGRGRNFGGRSQPSPTPQISRQLTSRIQKVPRVDSIRASVRAIYRLVPAMSYSRGRGGRGLYSRGRGRGLGRGHGAIYRHVAAMTYPNNRMGLTENNSATYLTSDKPCLDFFFHVVPDTPPESVHARLKLAWEHDPLKALKLVCNLRGVRGTGKTDKENFYAAALWLHENHPKTLACNVESFAKFGCFKDLPEILFRLLEGFGVRKERKEAWCPGKRGKGEVRKAYFLAKKGKEDNDRKETVIKQRLRARVTYNAKRYDADMATRMRELKKKADEEKRRMRARVPREQRIAANAIKVKKNMEKARRLRRAKDENMAKRHEERYEKDENYKFLHDCVANFFAKMLKLDLQALNSGEVNKISLAAKWCPSIHSAYDKATLLCKSISQQIFPREEYQLDSEEHYVYKIRNRLRKEFLVPLHDALKLPEVYMSAKQWGSVPYERVASVAMRNYTDVFLHRDNGRFKGYLENVKVGNSKIAAGALLPHEIIEKNVTGSSGESLVSELQWKRMVSDLSSEGKLTNCIAVCDVSGSMSGTPMQVAIALGLLVSELSEEPWKGRVITFSAEPQLHIIEPGNLMSKVASISAMNWGMNTNFQKVFDCILEVAVNGKLSEDQMIKTIFVFSDMEFDEASSSQEWETDYMVIKRKFLEKGFQNVPQIVFWNLRDSHATPVTATENGVAMVSGFSKNLLKLFLEEGGNIVPEENGSDMAKIFSEEDAMDEDAPKGKMNPQEKMEAAISGELYQELVLYD